jgi:hypothetical protein
MADLSQYKVNRTGNTGVWIDGPDGPYFYAPYDALMGGAKVGNTWYYPEYQSGAMGKLKSMQAVKVPDSWVTGLSGREISDPTTGYLMPKSVLDTIYPSTYMTSYGDPNAKLGADNLYHWGSGNQTFSMNPWASDGTAVLNTTTYTQDGGGGLFGGFLGDLLGGLGEAIMDIGPILPIAAAVTGNPILMGLNAGSSLAQGNVLGAVAPFVPGMVGDLGGAASPAFDAGSVMDAGIAQGAANAAAGGSNMSWLSDLAAQDFADFGITGVESLGDALNYSTGAADFTAGISNATQAADFLRNLGMDTNTALGLVNSVTSAGISPANALKAILGGSGATGAGITGAGLLGTAGNIAGGYLNTQAAKEAAQIQANAQIEAAKIAAEAAKFKPVGVTTRFGQSQFGYDDKGNLTSAGYTLSPEMKAQQDALMATSGGLLSQFQGSQTATAPMGTAAQRAMQLGQGYLATDPATQAKKYMAEQQALLATGREREYAQLQQRLASQGRLGLATGGTTTGMMAANPEMEAFANAKRQQDLQLAAQATQGGMDYAKFGAGMVGTGSDLLKSMYGTQAAAYQPYQTAMGGAQTIEGLGQNALTQGISLGSNVTAANAAGGSLLGTGMMNAANTVGSVAQQAGSPWGNLLQGAGNYLNQQAQPNQQMQYNPYTGQKLSGYLG